MKDKIQEIRRTLNRSIFVGERYERNIQNMIAEGYIILAIGVLMVLVNLLKRDYVALFGPLSFLVLDVIDLYYLKVRRSRRFSVIVTCVAVVIVFTYCILYVDNGFAFLWTLFIPLSICYIYGVKEGILLSAYFEALYILAFYTPFRQRLAGHFPDIIFDRFPILFFFNALITIFVMYQYHKSALFEIDYTNKLSEEVKRQTAVAEERSRKIEKMSLQTIETLANAIDAKDPYTKGHSSRVSQYSAMTAEALGWRSQRVNDLRYAALLHDIGKIGVPDSILNNPKRLTDAEYEIIKSHTTTGAEILRGRIMIGAAEDVARGHHERYDGRGYPLGLKGTEICEEARIVAIADAFDAMSSNRIYRKACDPDHIRNELLKGKGKQFDPAYTDVFIGLWDRGLLDGIIGKKGEEAAEGEEAPSALLQTVLDSFIAQDSSDDVDMNRIVQSIRSSGSYDGAMDVEYRQFAQIYEYIENLEKRYSQSFKLIMVKLEPLPGTILYPEELENSMYFMEQAIRQTVRGVDVVTRYSRQRFLIILLGTDEEGVRTAMGRIFRGYYKMNGSNAFTPFYTVADPAENR